MRPWTAVCALAFAVAGCAGLTGGDETPTPTRRIGKETDNLQQRLDARIQIVAQANLVRGNSKLLHDFLLRGLNRVEDQPQDLTE